MPEPYSWETREQAEELYIIDGLTYEQVAERTGVSLSQLKRWGGESTWVERRREYRQAQTTIRRGVTLAKAKAVNSLLETVDPQTAYAFASLVSSGKIIEQEARENRIAASPVPAIGSIERPIKTAEDAVAALQEAVEKKINIMLTQPGAVSLSGIKEMQQAMQMLDQLKTKYKPEGETAQSSGLSDEAAESIRKRILGMRD
jgi:transposase-like protein